MQVIDVKGESRDRKRTKPTNIGPKVPVFEDMTLSHGSITILRRHKRWR